MGKYATTIDQELRSRNINQRYFDDFYARLLVKKELPDADIMPYSQYDSIVDYLREQNVLGRNAVLLKDGLNVFFARKHLEDIREVFRRSRGVSNAGGIMPCRRSRFPESAGGMMPCRDYDD